ncbi:MAG: Hpt domain-containing protein [Oscillospiraceae bacterium]|nr:Hpt domain-containing protein [Oscillospiraceae bacterium]
MGLDGNEAYLPYIDVCEGTDRLMNNFKLYLSILKKFDAVPLVEEIVTTAADADYEGLQRAAHTLKGAAGNLSLTRLYEVAFAIEQRAKEETSEDALLAELQEVLAGSTQAIQRLIAESE